MTSTKPYLLRAFYDWIVDNNHTPYLAINAEVEGTIVPKQYIENGKITLNISPLAVRDLNLGNEVVTFSARFSGVLFNINVPLRAILAIYARENGRGMVFGEDENEDGGGDTPPPPKAKDKTGKPKLTVVK